MANNDDSRRGRDGDRPEDNPFVAFRRFADSQVSSLLNTVFTLPATLANFNNAHHAREQCLFGKADQRQCEQLQDIEERVAKIRSEGRELYKVGDVQAVLKKGEELMQLDRQADGLRRDIVEAARRSGVDEGDARKHAELVEKVGSEKGQQWGWSWSWGFPRPFDEEGPTRNEKDPRGRMCRQRLSPEEEIWKRYDNEEEWKQSENMHKEFQRLVHEKRLALGHSEPKVWSWSWSWPPPADASNQGASTNDQPRDLFDELGDLIVDEVTGIMGPPSKLREFAFQNEPYNPRTLERDEQLKKAGVQWRDAFEDLYRADTGSPLMSSKELGHTSAMPYNQWVRRFWDSDSMFPQPARRVNRYPKRVPWEDSEPSDEPSYEYSHDHEDQHDDPPTPKVGQGEFAGDMPKDELEAYERLLGPATSPSESAKEPRSSILSTLTTTERTVAPDGTVTTKVVLKKRFADGREESSETVHTHRGQETETQQQDPWRAMQEAQFPPASKAPADKDQEKKKGWFWSS